MSKKIIQFNIALLLGIGLLCSCRVALAQESLVSREEIIAQTNQERKNAGLNELTENELLNQAAMRKAEDMLANNYFAHTSPKGVDPWHWFESVDYPYRYAGENLAMDFTSASSVDKAWMKSPTHRANILSDKFQEIGVAVVTGTIENKETLLAVQLFGTPLGETNPPVTAQLKNESQPEAKPEINIEEASVYPWKGNQIDELLVYAKVSGEPAKVEAVVGEKSFDLPKHRDNIYMNLVLSKEVNLTQDQVVMKISLNDGQTVFYPLSKDQILSKIEPVEEESVPTVVAASHNDATENIFQLLIKQNILLCFALLLFLAMLANIWILEKEEERLLASYQA